MSQSILDLPIKTPVAVLNNFLRRQIEEATKLETLRYRAERVGMDFHALVEGSQFSPAPMLVYIERKIQEHEQTH